MENQENLEPIIAQTSSNSSVTSQPQLPNQSSSGCGCGGSCGGSCSQCASKQPNGSIKNQQYVYVLGHLHPRYPNLGVEKEVAQALGQDKNKGVSDEQALHNILQDRNFRYLTREICWSVAVESVDSYIIKPTDGNISMLLESLQSDKDSKYIDVIIGRLGPIAEYSFCNGAMLPTIDIVQLYSFNRSALIKQLPISKQKENNAFGSAVKQTMDIVSQMSGNRGVADGHRAINYLITRSSELYELVANQLMNNASLIGLSVRTSELSGSRRVYEVILTFRQRGTTITDNFSAKVDVTDVFPFLVSPLSPYFDRR